MASPAQNHFRRVTAARASTQAAAGNQPLANANAYELMLVKLDADRRRLKQVQSVERKAEVKRELLPDYEPWVRGVLDSDSGVQDDILMTVLVWRIDAGDYAGAIEIAAYALTHKLTLPDQYQRTLGCLLAEEFAESALKALAAGMPVDIGSLATVASLTEGEDMPDEVRAKLLKATGLPQLESNPTKALELLKAAFALHDKVGVKKEIERLERVIKNLASTPDGAG